MSHNKCMIDHPELIEICMSCTREDCRGECERYRAKFRELMGLPPLETKPEPGRIEKRGRPRIKGKEPKRLEAFGKKLTIKEWAAETGIEYRTLHKRLEKGMPLEKALSREVCSGPVKLYTYNGESHSISEWARLLKCARSTLNMELNKAAKEGACCDGGNH